MRIVFAGGGTGGHLYPGLAIARAVQRLRPDAKPFFVGAQRGIEKDVLPGTGFPFILLDLHPLYRPRVWNNWRTLRGLVSAWSGIGQMVRDERPAVVVGTGGYAAGAMMAYAAVHGIPLAQQASDAIPSLTTRMFASFSREVYLAIPEAAARIRGNEHGQLIDTGAPIEPPPDPLPDKARARAAWDIPADALVVLISGGSQGALAVNRVVASWVQQGLPDGVHVIWGTGRGSFDEFRHLESSRVKVRAYLSPIADAYAATDLAVTRAGMMTIAELCAWRIPAVLIPLPTAAADHQTHNAVAMERAGAAIHLPQATLAAARLDEVVRGLATDRARLAALSAAAARRARPHAAEEIARRVIGLADH